MDQAALLDRYIGVLPDDLAEPAATPTAYARWRTYDRCSWPEYLRSRGAPPEAITRMTVGGDATDLSALFVLRQFAMLRRSTQRYKIAGGMDLLPRAMASALGNIMRYNVPSSVRVTSRSRSRRGFRVEYRADAARRDAWPPAASSSRFRSRRCERSRSVRVCPRRRNEPSRSCLYYAGTRVLLQSRSRFWRSADLSGSARTDRATEVWDSTFDQVTSPRGILGASFGGGVGRTVLDMTPQDSLSVRDRPGGRCVSCHSL